MEEFKWTTSYETNTFKQTLVFISQPVNIKWWELEELMMEVRLRSIQILQWDDICNDTDTLKIIVETKHFVNSLRTSIRRSIHKCRVEVETLETSRWRFFPQIIHFKYNYIQTVESQQIEKDHRRRTLNIEICRNTLIYFFKVIGHKGKQQEKSQDNKVLYHIQVHLQKLIGLKCQWSIEKFLIK